MFVGKPTEERLAVKIKSEEKSMHNVADFQGRDFSEHAKLMFSCDFFFSKESLDERRKIFSCCPRISSC